MKKAFAFTACMLAVAAAHATCHNGATNYPACDDNKPPAATPAPAPTTSKSSADAAAGAAAGAAALSGSKSSATGGKATAAGGDASASVKNSNAAAARQAQRQQQAQRQAQTTNVTGAGQNAGAGAAAGAGSDNGNGNGATVSIDSADRSSASYRSTVWAPVIHGESAAPLASAGLIALPNQCGPRVRAITTQLVGVRFGFLGGQSDVAQGYTQELGPELNEDGTEAAPFVVDGGYVYGHRYTILAAALGTSSANSFSVGGFHGGDGAQGGAASSGGMQQIGTRIVISRCVYAVATPPAPPAPLLSYCPQASTPKPVFRKKVVRRQQATCVAPRA